MKAGFNFFFGCAALSLFICGALTFYFFFTKSDYFLYSLVSTIVVPIFFVIVSMFFGADTRFLMTNILIVPALILTTWFVNIKAALLLWLTVEFFVFLTRRTSIQKLKRAVAPPSWINKNHREVYSLHGLISGTAAGYLYFLGYENGILGHASSLISSVGKDGVGWGVIRFSLWPILGLFLVISYLFLMMFLREILEHLTLNHKVSDLLDGK